jgi:manganese transport protein
MKPDPYILTRDKILDPPRSLAATWRFLGPGFVLSATIVGSGELIATTTLGAQAGFTTFWVILASCLVKVAIQVEFGRHTILTGESAMSAMNKLPGPRIGKAKWPVGVFLFFMLVKLLQVGGIIGGVAIILHMVIPSISLSLWALSVAVVVALLIFRGYYSFIEGVSVGLIGLFTIFTILCVIALQFTPYSVSWQEILSGLQLDLPRASVGFAIAAFGITGVGGEEIIYYNYWCLEKGYAAYSGPPDDSEAWKRRSKGWIKVMYIDATVAMLLYTGVTAAFYLLGSAVLFARGEIPEGYATVEILSAMYTETLGDWARPAFLAGAFFVLFSTLFAALAAWTRLYSDIFGQMGWIDFTDMKQRKRMISILAWVFPFTWALLYLYIQLPVFMVLTGGVVGSFILLLVVFAALHFRYRRLHPSFIPGKLYDFALWISVLAIVSISLYGLIQFAT